MVEILESQLTAMRGEIYHAEYPPFKDDLKEKKAILEGVIDKFREGFQLQTLRKTA